MVKLLELTWTDLSIDKGTSSVELPWTSYSEPQNLNVTHVELENPMKKMRQTIHTIIPFPSLVYTSTLGMGEAISLTYLFIVFPQNINY